MTGKDCHQQSCRYTRCLGTNRPSWMLYTREKDVFVLQCFSNLLNVILEDRLCEPCGVVSTTTTTCSWTDRRKMCSLKQNLNYIVLILAIFEETSFDLCLQDQEGHKTFHHPSCVCCSLVSPRDLCPDVYPSPGQTLSETSVHSIVHFVQ